MSKIKLLLVTDSAAIHTGLAETTRLVFRKLLEKHPDKYDIHQLGWYNIRAAESVPWPIYNTHVNTKPDGKAELDPTDRYGQRTFESIREKIKPDIVYSNGDLWCFDHILNSPNRNSFRLVTYYTIDGTPYWGGWLEPDEKSEWGEKLVKADRLVVLTEWGEHVLKNSCPELKDFPIEVIYHPSVTERFKVLDDEEKKIVRQKIYSPQINLDGFIMGWVGRNQFRKQNHKMWEVLHYMMYGDYIQCNACHRVTPKEWDHAARKTREVGALMMYDADYDYESCWHCKSDNVVEGKPLDDVYLWFHMNKQDPGWNPDLHSRLWDCDTRCIYTGGLDTSQGLPPDALAQLISSWDTMLYLSGGEGFGIPAYESIQCGVPVVYSNYSSHADFCKHGGLPVRVGFQPELAFAIQRAVADTGHAIEQILKLYNDRQLGKTLGQSGREYAATHDVNIIADKWDKVFTEMMDKPLPSAGNEKIYAQTV